jgi:adenylate kinase family enzyme
MKKVLIIGSGGAGKSTFARRLGEVTGIEVVHLDRLYWNPNWVETPKDEWKRILNKILERDSWIMDGNYSGTMEMRLKECDTTIFLDLPRALCLWRILKRVILYRKGTRPDMAEGCREKLAWDFLKWIWTYPAETKPKVEGLLKRFQDTKTIVCLKSNEEIENFLSGLNKN